MRNHKYGIAALVCLLLAGFCFWNIADMGNVNTRILLPETTAPTAIADHGQLWTTSDDLLHFQSGAGFNRSIVFADYANIYVDDNAVATIINVVDAFEHITVFDTNGPESISDGDHTIDAITVGDTGDYVVKMCMSFTSAGNNKVYELFGFEVAVSGDTISGATQANPCVVTATAHSFSNGNRIKITGVVGMVELNDRIFTVANAAANTFELNNDNAGNIDSTGFTAYGFVGTAFLATKLTQVNAHRKIATGADLGSWAACGIVSLTANNLLELWIKGDTDATNMTVETCSFMLQLLK